MPTLIEIQREAEKALGLHTLSTDYEIVYILLDFHDISPDALHKRTRLSSTAFYNKIKDLEKNGAIVSKPNPEDRRGKLYGLSNGMRALVINQHKGYINLTNDQDDNPVDNVDLYHSFIHKGKIVNHLTSEFQILLYMYLKSGISNLNMASVVDVSPTKFNTSLTKLVSMGLVNHDKDPADGRSKLYYLSKHAQRVLDRLHTQVADWIATNA